MQKPKTALVAGIDAGSRTLKVVLLDARSRAIAASKVVDQQPEQAALARDVLSSLLRECGAGNERPLRTIATGYGRSIIDAAGGAVTEITCHARGVRALVASARTIIDVGGQDSKVIFLAEDGSVVDFAMNERCAAGTGRFLEVVAERLRVDLMRLGAVARAARKPARINSTCVVFAESEITGLMARGVSIADIAAGVEEALAARVASLVSRAIEKPVVFTGGVALLAGMVRALSGALDVRVAAVGEPQLTGALGAALIAADELESKPARRATVQRRRP